MPESHLSEQSHNAESTSATTTIQGIPSNKLPRHITIIMDGNNRWAKRNKLKHIAGGHRAGVQAVRKIIECCRDYKIEVLSLFAFSSENWQRPKAEVNALMELFLLALRREVKKLHKHGIRLKVIGDTSAFSQTLQTSIKKAEQLTADNTRVTLLIAANYGGQWDITQAAQQLAKKVQAGTISPEDITEDALQQHLSTAGIPSPDLLIRTSGEHRISNFMLWQCAYSELYFTDTLWPDFNRDAFHQALLSYASRQRRFGQTSEQVLSHETNQEN